MYRQGPQIQMQVQLTKMVKWIIISNVAVWFLFVILGRGAFGFHRVFEIFGLVPSAIIADFWIWQPVTYMFFHSDNLFHILFNMFVVYWAGSEIEQTWGSKAFLKYYLVTGIGAGVLYTAGATLYYLFSSGSAGPSAMSIPVVGASGATFGLMLAYGILFGERTLLFMLLFPMKAKYFVMLLGGIEVFNLLKDGLQSGVSNLCHIGGLIVGYLYLTIWTRRKRNSSQGGTKGLGRKKGKGKLRLVIDNEVSPKDDGPRYWN